MRPRWLNGKQSVNQCRRCGFSPWVRKILWSSNGQPTPVFHSSILAWKIPWKRSLAGYSPWGRKESDITE